MTADATPGSSTLLLLRLAACPSDERAWCDFVGRYSKTVYSWCRQYGLQDADAQDVTQEVFTGVLRAVDQFDRSRGCVRAWLHRVVSNQVFDWCKSAAHRCEKGTEAARLALASAPAAHDLEARLNEEFDLELLETAEQSVRLQVYPRVWESYQLRCKKGLTLKEVAERVHIPAGHVSKYAIRVREMVADRVMLLEGATGPLEGAPNGDDKPVPARR